MANTPVEFLLTPGLALTLELYPHGSDIIANGVGDVCTEATNRAGLYTAIVDEALAGWYTAHIFDAGGVAQGAGHVLLSDTTDIHWVQDNPSAMQTGDSFLRLGEPVGNSISDDIAALDVGAGEGSYAVTATVTDGANPVQNASVRITLNDVTKAFGITDVNGQVTFSLNAATYTVSITHADFAFTPTTRTVTGTQAGTLTNDLVMAALSFDAPNAGFTIGYLYTFNFNGFLEPGAKFYAWPIEPQDSSRGSSFDTEPQMAIADNDGRVQLQLAKGVTYLIRRGTNENDKPRRVVVPADAGASWEIYDILGRE